MDAHQFDALVSRLSTHLTRRHSLGALGIIGASAAGLVSEADAKKKTKKVTLCHEGQTISVSKKAKKKHLKHGDTLGACPTTTLPPGPVIGPGRCGDPSGAAGGTSTRRFGQTFFPPRSGQLTKAEIYLIFKPDNFPLTFEIRSVTSGLPHVTLAMTEVDGDLATGGGDIRRVEVTFPTPATITVGQPYALVVTAVTVFGLKTNGISTPCPDGQMFTDHEMQNAWVDSGKDLVYAVTIA